MHIDWSWVLSAAIAAVISSVIRSSKGRQTATRLTALEDEVRALRERLGIPQSLTYGQTTEFPATASIPPGPMAEIESEIRQGKKINAIKVYREQTGVGLKEAKDAVEAMERRIKYRL
ncbi:MAG TPA: ribosomal protein L7/L12 [Capsulimonadaceae bacterium]|nr:ribosomal protein L7/L12 [Capsulimonadaceae bacterium]